MFFLFLVGEGKVKNYFFFGRWVAKKNCSEGTKINENNDKNNNTDNDDDNNNNKNSNEFDTSEINLVDFFIS